MAGSHGSFTGHGEQWIGSHSARDARPKTHVVRGAGARLQFDTRANLKILTWIFKFSNPWIFKSSDLEGSEELERIEDLGNPESLPHQTFKSNCKPKEDVPINVTVPIIVNYICFK